MISTYLYHAKNVQLILKKSQLFSFKFSLVKKPACPKIADNRISCDSIFFSDEKMKELLYLLLVNQVWSLQAKRQGKTRRFYLRSYFVLVNKLVSKTPSSSLNFDVHSCSKKSTLNHVPVFLDMMMRVLC